MLWRAQNHSIVIKTEYQNKNNNMELWKPVDSVMSHAGNACTILGSNRTCPRVFTPRQSVAQT